MTDINHYLEEISLETSIDLEAEALKMLNTEPPLDQYSCPADLSPSDMQAWLSAKSLLDPDETEKAHDAILKKYRAHQ